MAHPRTRARKARKPDAAKQSPTKPLKLTKQGRGLQTTRMPALLREVVEAAVTAATQHLTAGLSKTKTRTGKEGSGLLGACKGMEGGRKAKGQLLKHLQESQKVLSAARATAAAREHALKRAARVLKEAEQVEATEERLEQDIVAVEDQLEEELQHLLE